MARYRTIVSTTLLLALVISTGIRNAAASAPPLYAVADLGTLGGLSTGIDINDSGQATGYSSTSRFAADRAFLWTPTTPNGSGGSMINLGTLGGISSAGSSINNDGQVTGQSGLDIAGLFHAFLWTPTTPNAASGDMIDLGTLGGNSNGTGINASGQVSGYSATTGFATDHAFLWTPTTPNGPSGTMNDLGTLGGNSSAADDINASGQVTGYSDTTDAVHAYLWTPTTPNGASGTMNDLGTLGGTYSHGFGINAGGQVTGVSTTTGNVPHAFLYDGALHDLGTLGGTYSYGAGINAAGQVSGFSSTAGDVDDHAFLYTSGSGIVDLNSLIDPLSGWVLERGQGINDAGQITGWGRIGGQQHAFLLTPVPEPATWMLFCLASAAVAVRRAGR